MKADLPEPQSETSLTNLALLAVKFITRPQVSQTLDPPPPSPSRPTAAGTARGAISNTKATILSLPAELLLEIAGYLPLCSAAALALGNRYLGDTLGKEFWPKLSKPENKDSRFQFFDLIEKDQEFWACGPCETLHTRYFDRRKYYTFDDGHYAYRARVVHGEVILRMDVRSLQEEQMGCCREGTCVPNPCLHHRYTSRIMGSRWSEIAEWFSGTTTHIKADYPYVPRDPSDELGEGKCRGREVDRHVFAKMLNDPPYGPLNDALNAPWGWFDGLPSCSCLYCYSVIREAKQDESCECLARSYQSAGKGEKKTPKWIRSISPASDVVARSTVERDRRVLRDLFENRWRWLR